MSNKKFFLRSCTACHFGYVICYARLWRLRKPEESRPESAILVNPRVLFFILIGAVMILAMHGGFAFLEVGSVRKKNQVNALNKIFCEWSFSTLIYFLIGYPIARGVSFLVPIAQMAGQTRL